MGKEKITVAEAIQLHVAAYGTMWGPTISGIYSHNPGPTVAENVPLIISIPTIINILLDI